MLSRILALLRQENQASQAEQETHNNVAELLSALSPAERAALTQALASQDETQTPEPEPEAPASTSAPATSEPEQGNAPAAASTPTAPPPAGTGAAPPAPARSARPPAAATPTAAHFTMAEMEKMSASQVMENRDKVIASIQHHNPNASITQLFER